MGEVASPKHRPSCQSAPKALCEVTVDTTRLSILSFALFSTVFISVSVNTGPHHYGLSACFVMPVSDNPFEIPQLHYGTASVDMKLIEVSFDQTKTPFPILVLPTFASSVRFPKICTMSIHPIWDISWLPLLDAFLHKIFRAVCFWIP